MYKCLSVLAFTGTMLSMIFSKNVLMIRILMYFSIYMIIYVPMVINKVVSCLAGKERAIRFPISFLMNAGTIVVTLIPLVVQLAKNIAGVVPYTFWS